MDNKETPIDTGKFEESALDGIGRRIKALRKKLGLTQYELAGNNITRNMLSRIENGAALPSLGSLVYLAEKLGVPCGCLLDDTALWDHTRSIAIKNARELMRCGDYKKAYELISSDDLPKDDETAIILIECGLNLAREHTAEHAYFKAFEKLNEASALCDTTVYSNVGSGYIASLYKSLALRNLPVTGSEPPAKPEFDKYIDIYIYIRLMDMFDRGEIVKAVNLASLCEIENKVLSSHIAAKLDMANGRYNIAISKLSEIVEAEKKEPTAEGGLLLYKILGDLEACAKSEGDYVSAYEYREQKNKLFTAMSGIEL
jgi:transcriptional regulator with XRE-family HTH domain